MRIYLAAAIALGLLASCSSEQDLPDSTTTVAADTALRTGTALPFVARSMTTSFASLPDRGELLAYRQDRPVKHSGAFTAYPVALSEAHALNAIRTGEMVIKAPDGELIRLQYERFVEHPDGNWSWIGRNADGTDAVLTFGEKAVFGTIPQGNNDTLRLTMSGGRSWLVSTDSSKLNGAPPSDRPDHLVPPKLAAGTSSGTGIGTASMRAESATAAAAGAVVDVLIGYTSGLAAQLGGDSVAVTRANNLIVTTNQAYANSGVTMRVRLVGAMKVTYSDNTDNGDVLELLTGYSAGEGGGPIDTDPAFDALRAKRDELGADLVSLVRAFRTPENNGCGIAWLIGGGQTGIVEADEPFGYSVVSDGVDLDEGDNNDYFCREETLAHEMGHNMGQAHNDEDSDDTGVHAYSYGYREASTTGFYTIMAYPSGDGQSSIPYFANPQIKDKKSGRATGVANQSDNVRSMNITMPIIATFRDTKVSLGAARSDFDGDGKSDVLWRRSNGDNEIWKSANSSTKQTVTGVYDLAYQVVGVGDFNADGKSDILWRNERNGKNVMWRSASTSTQQTLTSVNNQSWKIVGIGDFDADGKSDILWRNISTGQNLLWKAGSGASQQELTRVGNLTWSVAGVGDFNGDGESDILWRNARSGSNQIWFSGDAGDQQSLANVNTQAWKIQGVGDFNADGKSDILWRNDVSGDNTIWLSGSASTQKAVAKVGNTAWKIVGVGDFNGDGLADILWRNADTNGSTIWRSASNATQTSVASRDANWSVVGF